MTLQRVLVTGGAGFLGSNFIRYLLSNPEFSGQVVNVDVLKRADIRDQRAVMEIFDRYRIDTVVHFAAESHVDRSIYTPGDFVSTNVMGTYALLEAARSCWSGRSGVRFHHISTDEVYGSVGGNGRFKETTPYDPHSPYSASKAASDHLVMSYAYTFGLPVTLTNSSNNFGPYQFPEKLIPYMIACMREGLPLPVYGDGKNIRDWIYVDDHNFAPPGARPIRWGLRSQVPRDWEQCDQ